ncbi:MAG TPA: hypothetical protein PKD64_07600 [Pirellulaceae bacterium]|nr:hypothetical protein [Pirellulaceae bacterium]HMO92051.1 hypothetical protein [Pirellulaceae bacterium]HMP68850.1 hypothetical protein [Pirellulaceae bacterium]
MNSSSSIKTKLTAIALAASLFASAPALIAQDSAYANGASQQQIQSHLARNGAEALLKGRQALAQQDVAAAKKWLADSKLHDDSTSAIDSPAKLETMIRRFEELVGTLRNSDANRYNQEAALFLLEQAEMLIEYGDFTTAESLVFTSRQFPAQLPATGRTPDSVMGKLATARGSHAASQANLKSAQSEAQRLLSQAQLAFDQKRFDDAAELIARVNEMEIPTSAFSDSTILPWELELKIRNARREMSSFTADLDEQIVRAASDKTSVAQAVYDPDRDTTKNLPVSYDEEIPGSSSASARGRQLFFSGEAAMEKNDRERAGEYYRLAWQYEDQLDPQTRRALQSRLAGIQAGSKARSQDETTANLEQVDGIDYGLRQKLQNDVLREKSVADRMMENNNPRGALEHLKLLREKVQESQVDEISKRQLTGAIDREITRYSNYIRDNIAQIENDEMNQHRLAEIENTRQRRYDIERKISQLVDDFERLKHEQRYSEALMVARQAMELAPDMEVVAAMNEKANIIYRDAQNREIANAKAENFLNSLYEVDLAATGGATSEAPFNFGNAERWNELSRLRTERFEASKYRSPQERSIYLKLQNQQIQHEFNGTPLSEALDVIANRLGVNIVLDSRALAVSEIAPDTPVSMRLNNPISVHSALNLILGNLKLVYVIQDEVIKVTSSDAQFRETVVKEYYVGDLVVPIQNFQGGGLQNTFISPNSPYINSWGAQPIGSNGQTGSPMMVNLNNQQQSVSQLDIALGQQIAPNNLIGGGFGNGPQVGTPLANQWGPQAIGNPGGITEADFDDLMNLIQETIFPDSWEDNGGTGRMRPFASNLSLVVTATQEVQDAIQDLLTRLRQLNDVQIVIEVRFITLSDRFFERIGIDFDFKIEDNSAFALNQFLPDRPRPSAIVGRQNNPNIQANTADLDLLFEQNSFASAVPQFGGDIASGATFGFAILSDIEVYFLLNAAKGDERTNIVEAPVVTMFNGQSASVNNTTQNPFVTSITPVVGDFAAAQQPVITWLPEGTQLNVQAVVSPDRRFVRMQLVPFFSKIESVSEFRFEGSRRVRRNTRSDIADLINALDPTRQLGRVGQEVEVIEEGTTVQLPVFAVTNISTTVSVPDGGTVLLGGIKSLSEGRTERGVPMLSNIPYISRLFKNVGIGRDTQSLMMMVSPKIIISEEQEQEQTGINSFEFKN